MARSSRTLLLAVLTISLLLAGCAATPAMEVEDGGMPSQPDLRAAVRASTAGSGVPGGAVLITGRGGEAVRVLFGDAEEGRPVSSDTRFAYRSITKSLVGTVVLQLVDEQKMSLDDPISRYVEGVPGGAEITIGQLGAMRSGIANYSGSSRLGELLAEGHAREPAVAELLELAYPASPEFAPGAEYEYSNTNTLLLGEAIERVTGSSWMEAVRRRILEPLRLGTVDEGFVAPELDAAGYQLADGEVEERLPWVAPGWLGAAGGLTGTVDDLATWGRALGSGSLLSDATQRERVALLGPITDHPQSPEYDRYGFAMGELEGWLGHTGNGLGFQALVMHDPVSGRTVAILINGAGEDPDLPAHMFERVLAALPAG